MNRIFVPVCTLAFALLLSGGSIAQAPERASTTADRQSLNVTIYNGGTALIHDRRRIRLDGGENRVAWLDVSGNMDPASALLRGLEDPDGITVDEQNFDFNTFTPQALLQRYVGRDVIVVHPARFTGDRETRERARLLGTDGGIVLKYADRIETNVRGYIIFPTSEANFRYKPTLQLEVQSARAGAQTLDLSYLTSGLGWSADYVGVLSPDEQHLALRGIITLTNTSGASYPNAHLQLVAGDVNFAQGGRTYGPLKTIASVRSRSAADVFSQEDYFEYHLYTLGRPATILDNQTNKSASSPPKAYR